MFFIKFSKENMLLKDCTSVRCGYCQRSEANSADLVDFSLCRCHQLGKDLLAANCNACHSSANLATCIDCSIVLCDG